MIYDWDKKLKKRLYVLEADIISKHRFDFSSEKDAFLQDLFHWPPLRSSQ